MDDGSYNVDWEKVEAIMIIIDYNHKLLRGRHRVNIYDALWTDPFIAAVPHSYTSPPALSLETPKPPLDVQDPFDVTGTYMRVSSS
jgi:hypothetical protein